MFITSGWTSALLAVQVSLFCQLAQGRSLFEYGYDQHFQQPMPFLQNSYVPALQYHTQHVLQPYHHNGFIGHDNNYYNSPESLGYKKPEEEFFHKPQEYYHGPQDNCHKPQSNFQRPQDNFQRPQDNFQRPQDNFQRPQNNFQRPQDNFQRPQDNFQRPQDNFQRPQDNFQRPDTSPQKPAWNINTPIDNGDVTKRQTTFQFRQTSPPTTTAAPMNNQASQQCIRNCPVTSQYDPVCGTNNVTYTNEGRLACAKYCGVGVDLRGRGSCAALARASTSIPPTVGTVPTSQPSFDLSTNSVILGSTDSIINTGTTPSSPLQDEYDRIFGTPTNNNNPQPNDANSNPSIGVDLTSIFGTPDQTLQPNPLNTGEVESVGIVTGNKESTTTNQKLTSLDLGLLQTIFPTKDPLDDEPAPNFDVRGKEELKKADKNMNRIYRHRN